MTFLSRRPLLLLEAAKTPADMPDGYAIVITRRRKDFIEFSYRNVSGPPGRPKGRPRGTLSIEEPAWPCWGAYSIAGVFAGKGWGPMLYDVAMEWASKEGGGLIADRETVSDEALVVWRYYLNRRGDVKKRQLDDTENTLTRRETDNCRQGSAEELPEKWLSKGNPLSKIYIKRPAKVMNALKAQGKLIMKR